MRNSILRFRLASNGLLRVHNLERNFIQEFFPFEMEKMDSDGVSILVKKLSPSLSKGDARKLVNRLKSVVSKPIEWSATNSFLKQLYSAA